MIYKTRWEPAGSWFIGGGGRSHDRNPSLTARIEFEHKCSVCENHIPKDSKALLITSTSTEEMHTNYVCRSCVDAIKKAII